MGFDDIMAAIMTALKDKVPVLKTVEARAGFLENEIERIPFNPPAAYVVYEGSEYTALDGLNMEERASFSVFLAVRPSSAGNGHAEVSGLLKKVLGALLFNSLGLDMEGLFPVRTSVASSREGLLLYRILLGTAFDSQYRTG